MARMSWGRRRCTNQGLDAILPRPCWRREPGAGNVADAALRIAASAEQTNQAVNSQRDQLAQLATAMNEMSATISDVAGHAENTARDTQDATSEAGLGNQDVHASVHGIQAPRHRGGAGHPIRSIGSGRGDAG